MKWRDAATAIWAVVGLVVVLTALTTVMTLVTRDDGPIIAIPVVVLPILGGLILTKRPGNRIGLLMLVAGSIAVVSGFFDAYARFAATREGWPGVQWAAWVSVWAFWTALEMYLVLLLLLFPTGQLLSPRWRVVVALIAVDVGLATAFTMVRPGTYEEFRAYSAIQNPLGVHRIERIEAVFIPLVDLALALIILLAVVAIVVRFQRSRGAERQQLKWFAFVAVAIITLIVAMIASEWLPESLSQIAEAVFGVSFILGAIVGLPAAIAIAVLRYRLYDIDAIISRTLVYGGLTASIIAVYVVAVTGLGALVRNDDHLAISLLATGVVAVLFQPLRERLQRGVNRLLYGERDDPYAVLSRLGRQLEATVAPEAVLPAVVHTVTAALRLPYAAIALRDGDGTGLVTAAAAGTRGGELLHLPLVYQGEEVGELAVAPRGPGEAFGPADQRLLDDLARQAGVAAHAVQLTAALQRARERLVTAREEERRRLRRDLHDGLGPELAGQAFTIAAARTLLARDPAAADALLDKLAEQTQAAVADIRRLVYGLRPPALDDLGLADALREGAAHYEQSGLAVLVEVDGLGALPPLPAAVEVAAYRIAQEALTNVARHAAARSCTVRLDVDRAAGVLVVEVLDDGRGLPVDRRAGVGLASMRERAEELGGSCTAGPRPGGGTRVRALLPLPREPEQTPMKEEVWSVSAS